jgi:Na+/proline symporter
VFILQGGMKATILNDFIQMLIVVGSLLTIFIAGAVKVGGNFWSIAYDGQRIEFGK